jgi:ribosome-binding factor A
VSFVESHWVPAFAGTTHERMKKHSQRAQRVGDQIQRELADLLATEVKDPRVGRVTITHVEVAADLAHATVYFSHLAGKEHAKDGIAALSRTAGFLRSELARRLDLYSVPQLKFAYDDSIESGMRLSSLIDRAIEEDSKHPKE